MTLIELDQLGQCRRSRTAEIVCALRAAETRRPANKRLIDDPYAPHFLERRSYRALCGSRSTAALARTVFDLIYPGYLAIVLLRNRCSEELITPAHAEGIRQVVVLGAGFDSTALRLPLADTAVFE